MADVSYSRGDVEAKWGASYRFDAESGPNGESGEFKGAKFPLKKSQPRIHLLSRLLSVGRQAENYRFVSASNGSLWFQLGAFDGTSRRSAEEKSGQKCHEFGRKCGMTEIWPVVEEAKTSITLRTTSAAIEKGPPLTPFTVRAIILVAT